MPLRHSHRRPVPEWLAQIDLPEPGALESCAFPLRDALEHSLYYPAAGIDGRPVQFLGGFIQSFFYVDYGVQERDLEEAVHGFLGYRVAGRKHLREVDLAPNGWSPRIPPQCDMSRLEQLRAMGFLKKPFADWYVFDRESHLGKDHGPKRFSLVYICGDGVATYQALYWPNKIAPKVLAIIQPGAGFGGNYTDFRDPEGCLAWTVLQGNGEHVPEYLVYGGLLLDYTQACWPDAYPEHVEWFQHVNGNGIWRRRKRV
jgi:hypothetical protein